MKKEMSLLFVSILLLVCCMFFLNITIVKAENLTVNEMEEVNFMRS